MHQNAWMPLRKEVQGLYASGDADLLTVQKPAQSPLMMDTALVGENKDLLVLLCYHDNMDSHNIFNQRRQKKLPLKVWSIKDTKKH